MSRSTSVDVWLVIGARRWARVVAVELCKALPTDAAIEICGGSPDDDLAAWLRGTGLDQRIRLVRTVPQLPSQTKGVAFIVDSAYRHHSTIKSALTAGYSVVSEKPLGFSRAEVEDLIVYARKRELALFCTNTYLFAEYLGEFKRNWLSSIEPTSLRVIWSDAIGEVRHGAAKSYDSSVPIIFDVLPHLANILLTLLGEDSIFEPSIEVRSGGSDVSIRYRHGKVAVELHIARHAKRRERRLEVFGTDKVLALDFAVEPGLVVDNGAEPVVVDSHWDGKRRPIAAMLNSVVDFFTDEKLDPRLSASLSAFGNALIDSVVGDYVDQQMSLDVATLKSIAFEYRQKEQRSITERVLPYLSPDSPLRRMTTRPSALNPNPESLT